MKTLGGTKQTVYVEPNNGKQVANTIQLLKPGEHYKPLVNCELSKSILFTKLFVENYECDRNAEESFFGC